ncbi:MAG: amidophosphoribosyltransferase [Anaerococcus sp.]
MSGILGIYSKSEINKKMFYGLSCLQHRGQDSAGIVISNGENLNRKKSRGLVSDIFDDASLSELKGNIGIGFVGSLKEKDNRDYNVQPLISFAKGYNFSLAHDGNLINHQILRTRLEQEGMMFHTSIDSEVILYLIARYYEGDIVEAVKKTMNMIDGGYSVVFLMKDKLVAFRGTRGIRPVMIGENEEEVIVASENSAIEILGDANIRDIKPGEIVIVDEEGIHSCMYSENLPHPRHCIFEYVYTARSDANIDGANAYNFRRRSGETLFKEAPCDADLVCSVPDSGTPSAIGYSQASGLPFAEGLVKNRYMGRTFIKPSQEERELAVKLKLNPLKTVLEGKRIVLLDDSIVRGTTSEKLIKRMRKAGAKEIHLRITSPPVMYPCYYGIDTPSKRNLIAANLNIEEMREKIGADSLAFISMEGFLKATGLKEDTYCKACFTGEYPIDPIII